MNVSRTENSRSSRRAALAALIGLAAMAAAGCNLGNLFAWAFAPRHPKETIKAEFPLKSERLVIVPYARTDILFEDPTAPVEIACGMVNEIGRSLGPTCVKTIIHPVQVARWQESNVEWPNMSLPDIAKAFQADTVLYVELEHYSMIEEKSANLYRGHIRARVQVTQTAAERNPVYDTTVETSFPEERQLGLGVSMQIIRAATVRKFAQDVVNKFHDYEKEVAGGRQ
jgi:hypothetical protein